MQDNDERWLDENYASLLVFARLNFGAHGRGLVIVDAPMRLSYAAALATGRIRYATLADALSLGDEEMAALAEDYDPATDAAIVVVTAAVTTLAFSQN